MRSSTRLISITVVCVLGSTYGRAQTPIIHEQGWSLTASVPIVLPRGAHYNPWDRCIYVATNPGALGQICRIKPDLSVTCLSAVDDAGSVVVDPADGDVFFTQVTVGNLGRFVAAGLHPTTTALFFQGDAIIPGGHATFVDGLRCAAGSILRLGARSAVAGTVEFGAGVPGAPFIHEAGEVPSSGGTRFYQVWYRNGIACCSLSAFNLSNGLIANWAP